MKSSEIANYIKGKLVGEDIEITGFSSLSEYKENTLVFAKKYTKEFRDSLAQCKNVLAIVTEEYDGTIPVSYIVSSNPRLDYVKTISKFFVGQEIEPGIHPTAVIEKGAIIGKNVTIGAHCYIGPQVVIGDNTVLLPNVSMYGKVIIGKNCYFKPGAVIGGEGFGFERDENGVPVHFPHVGGVIIGDDVYIGSGTTISRAALDDTIIEDHVKIDDMALIAHNVHIGANTIIIGHVALAGGVQVGKNCWIAATQVYQHIKIGNNCVLGMGSVVFRNVKDGTSVFGNPAKKLKIE